MFKTVESNSDNGRTAARGLSVRHRFEDDPRRGFADHRDFLKSVMLAARTGDEPENLRSLGVDTGDGLRHFALPTAFAAGSDEHSTVSDPYGGFLVPGATLLPFKSLPFDGDPTMGLTQDVPMGASPKVEIPARVDKDHSSSVSGGLQVYRRAETQTVDPSRMETERITLNAESLMGVSYASEELLTDSQAAFMTILDRGFRDEFAARLLYEKLSGSGVGQFLGVMNSPCLITVNKEGSQTADTINGANIVKMRKRCYGYSRAVWLANEDTYDQLFQAHVALTNTDKPVFQASNGNGPDMLLGRPIFFSEFCQTLGDLGDILLGNWNEYLLGTLQPVESANSIHVRFLNNERTFRFITRNAGAPWWRSVMTPRNSASTLSPFVTLQAR